MNFRNLTILSGILAVIVVMWIWPDGGDSALPDVGSSRAAGSSARGRPLPGFGETKTRRDRRPPPAVPVPRKPETWLLERYSAEAEAAFYRDADQGQYYEREEFLNFYGLMRGALEGDGGDLAAIFNSPRTDGAATEGFDSDITTLIEQLGDRYFAHQLAKQPAEVRKRILKAIWGRGGFPGERVDGIPLAGEKHYPFTGRLLFEVFPEL